MTTHIVSTTGELWQAFHAAAAGDTIKLQSGNYEGIWLNNRHFDAPITLTSLDPDNPAVFTGPATLRNVSNVIVEDIIFEGQGLRDDSGNLPPGYQPQLFLNNVSDVWLRDLAFDGYIPTTEEGKDPFAETTTRKDAIAGYGYETGLRISHSDGVTVENSSFRDLQFAIHAGNSTDVVMQGLSVEAVREGIMLYDMQHLTIADSTFRNFKPWLSPDDDGYENARHDHPDIIQYWGDNSTIGMVDVTITGNLFDMGPGQSTQSIFGHTITGPDHVVAQDFTVTHNTILNGHPNAIYLGDVDGGLIAHNVILPNSPDVSRYWAPSITAPRGENITVSDNVLVHWKGFGVWALSDVERAESAILLENNTLLSDSPGSPDYWENWGQSLEILGTPDADVLLGTDLEDTIRGMDGDDTIDGGLANDSLDGGDGTDTYLFDLGDGDDTIAPEYGSDANVLLLGAGIGPSDLGFVVGDDLLIEIGASDSVRLEGFFTAPVSGLSGDLSFGRIEFADGHDAIDLTLDIGLGRRDVFVGDRDASDVFILGSYDKDQIRNLDISDRIDLRYWGVQSFEELTLTDRGFQLTIFDEVSGNAAYAYDATNRNPAAEAVTADNFIFAPIRDLVATDQDSGTEKIYGRAGDDLIQTGDGFNLVYGGGGADTFEIGTVGNTILKDYTDGIDHIDLSNWGVADFDALSITENGSFVIIRAGEARLRIDMAHSGTELADLDATDFLLF